MFSKTLYYPWIDIHDDSWVKTAILYWDEVNTIVPYDLNSPYRSQVAKLLQQERILRPFHVNPSSIEVKEASDIALKYLSSPEGQRVITMGEGNTRIHADKMSYQLKHTLGLGDAHIHNNKMSHNLMTAIGSSRIDDDGFISMDSRFTSYYMSALANRIAKHNALSTVADSAIYNQFNVKLSKDGYSPHHNKTFIRCPRCRDVFDRFTQERIKDTGECPACGKDIYSFSNGEERDHRRYISEPRHLIDGILAEIVIESIFIPNSVGIDQLLKFRQNHSEELVAFRGALQALTRSVMDCNEVEDIRGLRQQAKAVLSSQIQPKVKSLKSELKGAGIKCILSDFTISGLASVLSTAVTSSLGTYALLAGAGVSIGVTSLLYFNERRGINNNPYSYVLSMGKKLT